MINKTRSKTNAQSYEMNDDNNQFLDEFLKPPFYPEYKDKLSTIQEVNKSTLYNNDSKTKIIHIPQNRSIKNILNSMRIKQKLRKEQTERLMMQINLQKEDYKKIKQFALAERRIKTRIKLIEKREKLKEQFLAFAESYSLSHSKKKQKPKSVDDINQKGQFPKQDIPIRKQIYKKDIITARQSIISQISIPKKRNNNKKAIPSVNNISNMSLPTIEKSQPSNQQSIQTVQKERKNKLKNVLIREDLQSNSLQKQESLSKYRNYLHEMPHRSPKNVESQLKNIYQSGSQKQIDRASDLVKKLVVNQQLKQRNTNQIDYLQAKQKIRLLKFMLSAERS